MKTFGKGLGFLGLKKPLCDLESAQVVIIPFWGELSEFQQASEQLIDASHGVSPYGDDLVSGNFFNMGVATSLQVKTFGELAEIVGETYSLGKIPIILGGDKEISIAPVMVFNEKFGNLVVLSFDAHCNLEIFDIENISPRMAMSGCAQFAKQIILVGVRYISEYEQDLITNGDKERIRCFRMRKKIRRVDGGIKTMIRNLEHWLKDKNVYVSFDSDVLSSYIIRDAVPYPEPGGFTYDEALDIFEKLLPQIKVVGADFSGLWPEKHHFRVEVYMIAKLISRFIVNLKI